MSEEITPQETTTPAAPAAPAQPVAPALDMAAIQAQAAEAVRAARESQEATQRAIQEERQRMANAILGRVEEEPAVDPVLKVLLENPREALSYVKQQAKQEAVTETLQAFAEHESTKAEVSRVFGTRPDITSDPMNLSVIRGFLDQTDSSLPVGQRLVEAVGAFDRFMDARTGTSMQQRIAAVSTVPSAGGYDGRSRQEQARLDERGQWQAELDELKARRNAQRNFS